MLVVLGPPFEGTDSDYALLSRVTGLVAYDLKTRVKPGVWGVVRALGNELEAAALVDELRAQGFRACALEPAVGGDPARPFVPLTQLELGDDRMVLHLTERSMTIPYRALLVMVRGEVHLGSRPPSEHRTSSSTFRAVMPSAAEVAVFREKAASGELDAYAAVDIHFATVSWAARIDARGFDFAVLPERSGTLAGDLDLLMDLIVRKSGVRVDRGARASSLVSFAGAPPRSGTPVPGQPRIPPPPRDDRFDAYSRLVAEAERLAPRQGSEAPPAPV